MTGNVLVVTAINFDPKLNTITNMLIQNLAFTDICMASLHMPFWSSVSAMDAGYLITCYVSWLA